MSTLKETAIFVAVVLMIMVGHTLCYHLDNAGVL